jgi:hypothetical protein
VAQQQFILRGRARVHAREAVEKSGPPDPLQDGIEAFRAFGVRAASQVLANGRVGQEGGRAFHVELR